MSNTTPIEAICLAEKTAQEALGKASTSYRAAWWATTFALAEPTEALEIRNTYDKAESILGQNRGYLGGRRALGLAFSHLKAEITDLTPRKAMEVIRLKVTIDQSVVDFIRESDRNEESLREFSAGLTGKTWSSGSAEKVAADLAGNDPKKLIAVVNALPPAVRKAVATQVARLEPEMATRAVLDNVSNEVFNQTVLEHAATQAGQKLHPVTPEPCPPEPWLEALRKLTLSFSTLENIIHNLEIDGENEKAATAWNKVIGTLSEMIIVCQTRVPAPNSAEELFT